MDKTGNGNALDSKVTGVPTREPQKCKFSERAIAVLGEEGVDAAGLIAALKRVRAQSIQPIGERLDVCQQFVERARKRLVAAEDVVMKALQTKSRLECAQRRCAEVAALAGRSSRINPVPRGASKCTRGASGRGQPIARHHRGSAAREGSVAIRGCPANAPKKIVRWNS